MENKNENSILKCFVSVNTGNYTDTQEEKDLAIEKGRFFRNYIWGEKGISKKLDQLKYTNYGKDLVLILFQFYVNPFQFEINDLPEIEKYRIKEKSIGIPIVINDESFFKRSEEERYEFLKEVLIRKIDLISEVVRKKKLDTNIEKLKTDLFNVLSMKI